MKNLKNFAEALKTQMENKLPEGKGRLDLHEITSNNRDFDISIVYRKEGDGIISPSIKLSQAYEAWQKGTSLEAIAEKLLQTLSGRKEMPDEKAIKSFLDADWEPYICCKLINAEANKALLEKCPHRLINDLAVIYQVKVPVVKDNGTITLTHALLEQKGMDEEKVHSLAREYLKEAPSDIINMGAMAQMMGFPFEGDEDNIPMFILSNPERVNGAVQMVNTDNLDKVCQKMGVDKIFIIPSSIHEVLCLPYAENATEYFANMVFEVNTSCVAENEVLSNSLYSYEYKSGNIEVSHASSFSII